MKSKFPLVITIALSSPLGAQQFGGEQIITTAADSAMAVLAIDLDGDGDADVLSASSADDKIAWYENQGGGTFGQQRIITTIADGAESVYAIDLDGDGDADVLSASILDDKIAWYENQGGGAFGQQRVITTETNVANTVYAIDLDGDGDADVLSTSNNDDKIAWYENQGNGNFGQQNIITTEADGPLSVYAIDLDGDGDADVLSASGHDDKIAWYENLGGGNFWQQQIITTAANEAWSVYAADMDGDGDADVLSASVLDNKIAWYENQGGGTFGQQKIITMAANGAHSVYAIDLDGDGDADVLSASKNDDTIAWYENQGGGNFGQQQIITTAANGARSVYAMDLDGDGDADVLSASYDDDKIAWYENLSVQQGGFRLEREHSTGSATYGHGTRLGDLDGDGFSEYGVTDRSLHLTDVFDGASGQLLRTHTSGGTSEGITGAPHADITGDGIPEYALGEPEYAGSSVNEGRVLVYSGANGALVRTISGPASTAVDQQFGSRVTEFVDLNSDGKNELLVSSLRGGTSGIYSGSVTCVDGATGSFLYTVNGVGQYNQAAMIADLGPDLDGDGIPEFAIGAREAFSSGDGYLRVHSGSTGQAVMTISGFGGVNDYFGNSHCWTDDQDGDGFEDLIIGAPNSDTYGVDRGQVGVFSSATGALIREIVPPAEVLNVFGAAWRSRLIRLPDSDGDGKEEVLLVAREANINGVVEGVVYVCSPTTGAVLDHLVCPTRPMSGFGIQSELLDYTPEGWPRLLLGGSDLIGSGPGYAFVYVYEGSDLDADDDGLFDSEELSLFGTDPAKFDTDGDGLGDGMELGVSVGTPDTDPAVFIPDADPSTTTNPILADTDGGGVPEGIEDQNRDGRWDTWETDPTNPSDDSPAFYVSNLTPGEVVRFNAYGADPLQPLIPAYSTRGPGPTALGIGVSVDLSTPIRVLAATISDGNGEAGWNGPRVPAGISLGIPIWLQLVEIPFSSALPRVSNAILLPVGAN